MKPVYETSSENGSAQVQNVAILCNFVRPQKVQVRSSKTMSSYQCILRFFHHMSLKYCACHEKVIRSTAPVTQNLLSKPEDLMLQNVTHLRTSAPWPPATRNVFFLHALFKSAPRIVCETAAKPTLLADLLQGAESIAPATQNNAWTSISTLYIFTWKCPWHNNAVHFFTVSTSKSAPDLRCFVHFYLEMCLAPQRRTLFEHLNLQKCSGADNEVFLAFSIQNLLRATIARNF